MIKKDENEIPFWAKSAPPQTIQEHTAKMLEIYERFRKQYQHLFDSAFWALLRLAIIYHDCGKADFSFRVYMDEIIKWGHKPKKRADFIHHNYLSPAFLPKKSEMLDIEENDYTVLVRAIFYHHARRDVDGSELCRYIREVLEPAVKDFEMEGVVKREKLNTKFVPRIELGLNEPESMQSLYFRLKGMLNRIDYMASAGDGREELDMPVFDKSGKTIAESTAAYMKAKGFLSRKVQRYMEEKANDNVIVTAATGSGKTEAALLWIGNQKAFYTLPLKVSINAIYDRIVNKIAYDPTGLLHSDAQRFYRENMSEKQSASDDIIENPEYQYQSARLLAYPLTVCTVDQILDFAYKHNGGEMAAATLAYSKLVIDEIQMYSPNLVATILVALKIITDMGGKVAIITATFPPVLIKLMNKAGIASFEQSPVFHSEYTRRHRISLRQGDEFDFNKIIELAMHKKVLVLVNTVKRAQNIYKKILKYSDGGGLNVGILHSNYIGRHRKVIEERIKKFAPNSDERTQEPGMWISTQIVEASLDLDFDVLFTEMCGIDSLLQRMGRVFRSRLYSAVEPNVFILNNRNGVNLFIDRDIYEFSLEAVSCMDGMLLEESDERDDKQEMISMVYGGEIIEESEYYLSINKKIELLLKLPMYAIKKEEVKKMFRDIDTITVIPEQIYNALEKEGKIAKWEQILSGSRTKEEKRAVRDEIMDYTLSISHYYVDKRKGLLSDNELFHEGSRIFLHRGEYRYNIVDGKPCGRGLIREPRSNVISETSDG